jgi:hypothetical protein
MTGMTANTERRCHCIQLLVEPLRGFWGGDELRILGFNLAVHAVVQGVALQFMPLPYYSRLSLHDGNTYFLIAQNLWPAQPLAQFSWHKRFLHVLVSRLAIPWNLEWSFLFVGIVAASFSAVYFFKVVRRFTHQPFRLTLLYTLLPWLFFAAHHGLAEPLLMLTVLAGFYYFFEERYLACTLAFALALLTKELAAFPALAIGLLMVHRHGLRKASWFGMALFPIASLCLLYGLRWGDCAWCLRMADWNAPEGFFSPRTALYWIAYWTAHPPASSANAAVSLYYNLVNQILNIVCLIALSYAVYALWRRGLRELAFINTILLAMVFFLGHFMYEFNHCVGRKFQLLSTALVAYDGWAGSRLLSHRVLYWLILASGLALGVLWTFMYAKFFLYYKFF